MVFVVFQYNINGVVDGQFEIESAKGQGRMLSQQPVVLPLKEKMHRSHIYQLRFLPQTPFERTKVSAYVRN